MVIQSMRPKLSLGALEHFEKRYHEVWIKSDEQMKELLESEGYGVSVYVDSPLKTNLHGDQPQDWMLVILKGSMQVECDGKSFNLEPGDAITLPQFFGHLERVGDEGCSYLLCTETQ